MNPQQLESLVWERSGNLFVCSHSDGGYSVWTVTNGNTYNHQAASSTIPYGENAGGERVRNVVVRGQRSVTCVCSTGPFPCKAISKILWRTTQSG